MNELEKYADNAAKFVGLQLLEFPEKNRPRFLFEVLEDISPGLYARTLLNANAENQRGVPMGEAMHRALGKGIVNAVALQAIHNGTAPMTLDGFGSFIKKVGKGIGKIVAAPIKLVGAITNPIVSAVAKLVSGTLKAGVCPIVSTPAGQVAVVGAAAIASDGAATGGAAVGAQGMAAACQAGQQQAAQQQTVPQQIVSVAKNNALPIAAAGVGVLVLILALRRTQQ